MIEDYDNVDYEYFKEWNLEQAKKEIERLNNVINELEKEDYKSRNEKAIEYVEHHKFNKFGDIDCGEAEEIINILNGGDDNETME